MSAPYGYCQCGCGNKTPIAKQNAPKYGTVKGEPTRFLPYHHARFRNALKRGILPAGVLVDDADLDLVRSRSWHISGNGYVACNAVKGSHGADYLHRLILQPPQGFVCDHINGNRLDNRRANLRVVPQMLNAQNGALHRDNSTGYVGVTYFKANRNYRAYGRLNGKQVHLGYFDTAEAAAEAALAFRREHCPGFVEERHSCPNN